MNFIGHIKNRIELAYLNYYWKKKNKDNYTSIGVICCPMFSNFVKNNGIVVGNNTYGRLNVYSLGGVDEGLIIGSNCSISSQSQFLLGGEHNYTYLSTYPFKVMLMGETNEAMTKGRIVVEDECWIGDWALILSGVTIGKGAVVGAGSVVTKDVPPYAIVGGNPAKIIKFRFEQDIIDKIKNLDTTKIILPNDVEYLYQSITIDNVDNIVRHFSER